MNAMTNPSKKLLWIFPCLVLLSCTGADSTAVDASDVSNAGDVAELPADAGTGACTIDEDCSDFSACSVDRCVDGVCRFTRSDDPAVVTELMTIAEDVEDFEVVGSLLYLARGIAGAQVWNVDEIPPRKLAEVMPAEGHAPYTGIHQYEGGFIVRSGRWIYVYRSNSMDVRGEYRAADDVRDLIAYNEQSVILGLYSRGIEIVEIGNGLLPTRTGRVDTLGRAERLARVEDTLLVADGLLGVSLINIEDPRTPLLDEFTIRTEGRIDRVHANGRRVVVLEAGAGLAVLGVRNGEVSRLVQLNIDADILDVGLSDPSTMLVFTRAQGILFYDVTIPQDAWEYMPSVTVGGQIRKVGRSADGFVVLRDDNKVLKVAMPCGVEGDPFVVPPDGGAGDAGADLGIGLDAGVAD